MDFLEAVLADVADPQVAAVAIERKPPRVARAVDPDFGRSSAGGERVAVGNAVATTRCRIRVDAHDGAEQGVAILALPEDVICAAAVPEADPQLTIGTKSQVAAVVVARRLVERQQYPTAIGPGGLASIGTTAIRLLRAVSV